MVGALQDKQCFLCSPISRNKRSLTDLLAFLAETPRIVSKQGAIPGPRPIRDGLEFRDVSFHYPSSEKMILRNLTLRISRGERVAIKGGDMCPTKERKPSTCRNASDSFATGLRAASATDEALAR